MRCKYYKDGCSLNLYGGKPSSGVCRICPSYKGWWRGLGDAVAACVWVACLGRPDIAARLLARAQSLMRGHPVKDKPCGCKLRQARLNRFLSFTKD